MGRGQESACAQKRVAGWLVHLLWSLRLQLQAYPGLHVEGGVVKHTLMPASIGKSPQSID